MKLTIPTFFFGLMSLSAATTYSENKKLTLDLEGVILIDVFKQIESQTCSDLISTGYESPRSNIMSNADIVNEITSNSIAEAFIYPNPAFDKLNIKNTHSTNATIMIFDLQGKQVLHKQISFRQIDISKLPKGTYIVKLIDSGNIVIDKLVKL